MALRISKRSWRRAASRARCCAHFTFETATAARMPMIVTTTSSSMRVKPFCLLTFIGSPFVVVGLAVERQRRRRRVDLEDVVALADAGGIGLVVVSADPPFVFPGHRVDEVALAQEADDLAVSELYWLGQLLELLRPLALAHQRRVLHAVRRRDHAQLVVPVDGLGDAAQALAQLDLLLPPDPERQHREGDRGENGHDPHDGDEHGDGEASPAAAEHRHCTLAWPPETVEATVSPRPFFSPGVSMTR